MTNLPSNLPDLLRKHGLKVVEVPGWKTRGRPASTGGFAPVGVLCHDTVTPKTASVDSVLKLLVNGRSDLPGPLCQLSLGRDGTVYIVAAGRANHAGWAKASGSVAGGDGNTLYIGIEAQESGTGEPWSKVQYDAYSTLCAALCVEVTHNSVNTVRGHKETSTEGKIDPSGPTPDGATFDMDKFRGHVAAKIKQMETPTPAPTPTPTATTKRVPPRHVFHVQKGQPYHLEDSLRGIRLAVARLFKWIDLDCHKTADGVLIITHWPAPSHEGFADPAGKVIVRGKQWSDLTWAEVEVLRTKDGYRVQRADVAVPYALSKGIQVELELKTTAILAADLVYLRNRLKDPTKVQVKALPQFYTALKGAHAAGFVTILLARGKRFPKSAQAWLTYRRGRATWI